MRVWDLLLLDISSHLPSLALHKLRRFGSVPCIRRNGAKRHPLAWTVASTLQPKRKHPDHSVSKRGLPKLGFRASRQRDLHGDRVSKQPSKHSYRFFGSGLRGQVPAWRQSLQATLKTQLQVLWFWVEGSGTCMATEVRSSPRNTRSPSNPSYLGGRVCTTLYLP